MQEGAPPRVRDLGLPPDIVNDRLTEDEHARLSVLFADHDVEEDKRQRAIEYADTTLEEWAVSLEKLHAEKVFELGEAQYEAEWGNAALASQREVLFLQICDSCEADARNDMAKRLAQVGWRKEVRYPRNDNTYNANFVSKSIQQRELFMLEHGCSPALIRRAEEDIAMIVAQLVAEFETVREELRRGFPSYEAYRQSEWYTAEVRVPELVVSEAIERACNADESRMPGAMSDRLIRECRERIFGGERLRLAAIPPSELPAVFSRQMRRDEQRRAEHAEEARTREKQRADALDRNRAAETRPRREEGQRARTSYETPVARPPVVTSSGRTSMATRVMTPFRTADRSSSDSDSEKEARSRRAMGATRKEAQPEQSVATGPKARNREEEVAEMCRTAATKLPANPPVDRRTAREVFDAMTPEERAEVVRSSKTPTSKRGADAERDTTRDRRARDQTSVSHGGREEEAREEAWHRAHDPDGRLKQLAFGSLPSGAGRQHAEGAHNLPDPHGTPLPRRERDDDTMSHTGGDGAVDVRGMIATITNRGPETMAFTSFAQQRAWHKSCNAARVVIASSVRGPSGGGFGVTLGEICSVICDPFGNFGSDQNLWARASKLVSLDRATYNALKRMVEALRPAEGICDIPWREIPNVGPLLIELVAMYIVMQQRTIVRLPLGTVIAIITATPVEWADIAAPTFAPTSVRSWIKIKGNPSDEIWLDYTGVSDLPSYAPTVVAPAQRPLLPPSRTTPAAPLARTAPHAPAAAPPKAPAVVRNPGTTATTQAAAGQCANCRQFCSHIGKDCPFVCRRCHPNTDAHRRNRCPKG